MTNYDVTSPYGDYQTKGESPESILMKMSSWNKELRSTISDVKQNLDDTIERQSQIIQDVDKITLSVVKIDSRVGAAEASIEIMAGEIELKASSVMVDELAETVSKAGIRIDGIEGSVELMATKVQVDAVNGRLVAAEGSITAQAGQIALKANTAVVDGIGSRVSTAELQINSMTGTISSKVSYTDYNGSTIASLINQSASNITIAAQHIDMYGIVRVADSLELGYSNNNVTKAIKFDGNSAWIYYEYSALVLDSSYIKIKGDLDLSQSRVTGLNTNAKFG